jgi:phosphoribosylcarboxyaminoimidazole (NCAIR) mutase
MFPKMRSGLFRSFFIYNKKSKMILIVITKKFPETLLKAICSTLDEFHIKFKITNVDDRDSSNQSNSKKTIQVIVTETHISCLSWIQNHFPLHPCLQVPHEYSQKKAFLKLLTATNQRIGHAHASLALNQAGAINAALLCVSILANEDKKLRHALDLYRHHQTNMVLQTKL